MKCDKCDAYIKPKCVFYGESLSMGFYMKFFSIKWADLAFIIGTSLKVYPFAALPDSLPAGAWKVLINQEEVGSFDFDNEMKKDLFIEGNCDDAIQKLVDDCGWTEEFKAFCDQKLEELKKKAQEENANASPLGFAKLLSVHPN